MDKGRRGIGYSLTKGLRDFQKKLECYASKVSNIQVLNRNQLTAGTQRNVNSHNCNGKFGIGRVVM